jgi:hypothetical protein
MLSRIYRYLLVLHDTDLTLLNKCPSPLYLCYLPQPSVHHPLSIITMTATQIFTVFAGILALVGAYFYFFGIDPETKRELERKALKTMGENKMSYMAKGRLADRVWVFPTDDI